MGYSQSIVRRHFADFNERMGGQSHFRLFFHGILASGNLTLNPLNGYIGLSKILIPLFIDGYIMLYPTI